MNVLTASVRHIKNHLCQPPASPRKLNAAPVLCISVRLKPVKTATGTCICKCWLARFLVHRSKIIIRTVNHSHFKPSNLIGKLAIIKIHSRRNVWSHLLHRHSQRNDHIIPDACRDYRHLHDDASNGHIFHLMMERHAF